MKGLKKINIGLLLTIITIILIVAYCIHVENTRRAAKEDIMNACNSYIDATDKYAYLPEEYQVIGIKKVDVDLANYNDELEKELEKHTSTKGVANIEKNILSQIVETQLMDTSGIIVDFNRKIAKISSIQFSGNQVTVVFNSKISVKKKYKEVNLETGEENEKIREINHDAVGESITLEKIGNDWKVIYANLNFMGGTNPDQNNVM